MTSALVIIAPKLEKLIPLLASDWHDLAAVVARAEPHGTLEPVCWGDLPESEQAGWLAEMRVSSRLSPWEQNFCSSILAHVRFRPWSTLSPKQVGILDRSVCRFIEDCT
jgi:hypothetical protein